MNISGLDIIKAFEGFESVAYYDVTGNMAIGYGTLIDDSSEAWLKEAVLTEAQATELLALDCEKYEKAVEKLVKVELSQQQFSALVSLVYNIGVSNFTKSSVLKSINEGAKREEIETNWKKWRKSNGQVLSGLVRRRKMEVDLFFS